VLDVHLAFAICFGAVIVGDSMAFFMGRFFGRRVLASVFARRYFTRGGSCGWRAYFRKFGSKVVLVGRFTPGFASPSSSRPGRCTCGRRCSSSTTSWRRFFVPGAGLRRLVLRRPDRSGGQVCPADRTWDRGGVLIGAGVVAAKAWRRHKRKAERIAAVSPPGPVAGPLE